jgi:hypothetical protein
MRALVAVPFVAADLVGRAAREAADMERVKADLGVVAALWSRGAPGALGGSAPFRVVAVVSAARPLAPATD